MKKVLSVFMAILMLCGALSIGSSASSASTQWFGEPNSGKPANYDQTVFYFDLGIGTLPNASVYDLATGEFVSATDITGSYYMIPRNEALMKAGTFVTLPDLDAPDGQKFIGWYCYGTEAGNSAHELNLVGNTYAANTGFPIPEGLGGEVLCFRASFAPIKQEEPTLNKVMGILIKVFGAILGILLYQGNTEEGIAAMEKIFSGLF